MEDLGVDAGGRTQGVEWSHASGNHGLELSNIVPMCKDPHVTAKANRNSFIQGQAEAGALCLHRRGRRLTSGYPTFEVLCVGLGCGDGGTERNPPLPHEPEDLPSTVIAVFYSGDSRQHGSAHPFCSCGMGRDEAPTPCRSLNQDIQLVLSKRWSRLTIRPPPIIGVHLDPVGTVSNLVSHNPRHLLRSGCFLRALSRIKGIVAAAGPIAAGCHDGAGYGDETGARHDPRIDGTLQLDVIIRRSFGTKIALSGNTSAERRGRAGYGACHS